MKIEALREIPGRSLTRGAVADVSDDAAAFLVKHGHAKPAEPPSVPAAGEAAEESTDDEKTGKKKRPGF